MYSIPCTASGIELNVKGMKNRQTCGSGYRKAGISWSGILDGEATVCLLYTVEE